MDTLLLLDGASILIGVFSIYVIQRKGRALGGAVGSALNLFVLGISSMILAFLWTIVFVRLGLFTHPPFDPHHLFMATGMGFFVLAALKFTSIIRK